jgi:hypothetical protein
MQCTGLLGEAVGARVFAADAMEIMQVIYCVMLYCVVLYCAAVFSLSYGAILYGTVLRCTVQ